MIDHITKILTQISNSLIKLCTTNLEAYTSRQDKDPDKFWASLSEAVLSKMHRPLSTSKETDHKLITLLDSCLELAATFKEFVQQLKDNFLQQAHLAYPVGGGGGLRRTSNTSTVSSINNTRNSMQRSQLRQISESGSSSVKTLSGTPVGVSLGDVDQITSELGDFSLRVSKVLDVISTLAQFRQLNLHGKLEGLPRVAGLWELSLPGGEDYSETETQGRSIATSKRESPEILITGANGESRSKGGSESDITLTTPDFLEQMITKHDKLPGDLTSEYALSTLKEESVVSSSVKSASVVSSRGNEKGKRYVYDYRTQHAIHYS